MAISTTNFESTSVDRSNTVREVDSSTTAAAILNSADSNHIDDLNDASNLSQTVVVADSSSELFKPQETKTTLQHEQKEHQVAAYNKPTTTKPKPPLAISRSKPLPSGRKPP